MKYQSELIKEIVESRGHGKSSIHYESECVESWIEETKGAYPKLCDYQSEWLNYINENPIGNFPYEIITDVTEATVNNVVPYAYKSAILTGQTLVNCLKPQSGYYADYQISSTYEDFTLFKPNTLYTFINNWDKGGTLAIASNTGQITNVNFVKNSSALFTTPSAIANVEIYSVNGIHGGTPSDCEKWKTAFMVIEGDYTNVDIPYFEGMQSVKMPVLTTTGKNLLNDYTSSSGWVSDTGVVSRQGTIGERANYLSDYIFVEDMQKLKVNRPVWVWKFDANKNFISQYSTGNADIDVTDCSYIIIGVSCSKELATSLVGKIQIEQGTVATSYEPYKSNILTVNEDVELRDIKDSKYLNGSSIGKKFTDVLDCTNGELKIQTNKITMDGSKQPILSSSKENVSIFKYKPNDLLINSSYDGGNLFICDKLKCVPALWEKDEEGYCYSNNDGIMFSISNNKFTDINEYLSQNPITFIYPLAQESIKTVDLSIQDQDGNTLRKIKPIEGTMHIHSDGTPLNPTITMEIPVEATTQNLASFIKGE